MLCQIVKKYSNLLPKIAAVTEEDISENNLNTAIKLNITNINIRLSFCNKMNSFEYILSISLSNSSIIYLYWKVFCHWEVLLETSGILRSVQILLQVKYFKLGEIKTQGKTIRNTKFWNGYDFRFYINISKS